MELRVINLMVGLFHDMVQPPRNDTGETNFFGFEYEPRTRNTQKELYRSGGLRGD